MNETLFVVVAGQLESANATTSPFGRAGSIPQPRQLAIGMEVKSIIIHGIIINSEHPQPQSKRSS